MRKQKPRVMPTERWELHLRNDKSFALRGENYRLSELREVLIALRTGVQRPPARKPGPGPRYNVFELRKLPAPATLIITAAPEVKRSIILSVSLDCQLFWGTAVRLLLLEDFPQRRSVPTCPRYILLPPSDYSYR